MTRPIGHQAAIAEFESLIGDGSLHHAWLFTGPEGIGKALVAREMAARLLGTTTDNSLLMAGSHPDFRELRRLPKEPEKPGQDFARSITIAQVRGLLPMFATRPSYSDRRVILIDAIDDVERPGASNALLKSLEEPPAGTTFLLISHAPGKLLPTIRSRCRQLRFAPLSDADVATILRERLPDASEPEIADLVALAGGSPGRALGFAGLDVAGLDDALTRIAADGDPSNAGRATLAKALAGKSAQARYELFLTRAPQFIARRAGQRKGAALRLALDTYDEALGIAGKARAQSHDPQGTVFELAGLVARLAA